MSNNYREAIDAITANSTTKGPYQANWKGLIDALRDCLPGSGGGGGGGGTGGLQSGDNISELTNDVGYITSYTETSTLADVTGRGNSTTTDIILPAPTALSFGNDNSNPRFLVSNNTSNFVIEQTGNDYNGDFYIDVDTTLIRTKYNGGTLTTNATFGDGSVTLNGEGGAVLTTSQRKTDCYGDLEVSGTTDEGKFITGGLSMKSVQLSNTTTWNSYIQQGFSGNVTSGTLQIQNAVGGILIWSDNDAASSITLRVNSDISVKNMMNINNNGVDVAGDLDVEGGVILESPNGTKYKIEVADDGSLSTSAV